MSTLLFKTLFTSWRFQPASPTSPHPSTSPKHTLDDGIHANKADLSKPTLLTFDIVFAFSNPLHASVSGAFFGRVSRMMANAFEERWLHWLQTFISPTQLAPPLPACPIEQRIRLQIQGIPTGSCFSSINASPWRRRSASTSNLKVLPYIVISSCNACSTSTILPFTTA